MPIVTLTTDFGTSDHFAGVLKGVILSIAPRATIIDITHDVPPFSIAEGAFTVSEAYRYFPPKSIHLAVVDPGVGTSRRPILVEAAGHCFIGPDNGLLALVYSREKSKVRHITNARLFLKNPSATFHGRDIFAPAAAHLARGLAPSKLGPLIHDYLRPSIEKPVRAGHRVWTGTILKIDRFGNCITNFHIADFPAVRERPFVLIPGVVKVTRLVSNYAEAPFGEPCAIVGSSGYLEVAANQANAARILGVASGAPAELSIY